MTVLLCTTEWQLVCFWSLIMQLPRRGTVLVRSASAGQQASAGWAGPNSHGTGQWAGGRMARLGSLHTVGGAGMSRLMACLLGWQV
jgi:hypothetical protein